MSKKITVMFIVSFIFMLSIQVVYAGVDFDEEAKALNKMHLLSGDGIDFNLHGKLRRSEASAFIVKVKGMQNSVLQEKEKYASISEAFSDVTKDAWYAPYVGYCQRNGIISGFEDGTFRANEYVTEKQFLAMLLNSMEYDGGRDYDWDTVLNKAYEVGVSDKIEHAVTSEDNSDYYRKDVVHSIFLALDKQLDDEGITVVENLIEKGVTTESVARGYGVLKEDKVKTKLKKVELKDLNTLLIQFNEDIVKPSLSQVEVESDDTSIVIADMTYSDQIMELTFTTDLSEGPDYEVILKEIVDLDGYETDKLSAEFDGIEAEEIISDDFRIKRVEIIDEDKVIVEFTHPVSETAENVLYYRFGLSGNLQEGSFKNLEAKTLLGKDDAVLLEFEELEFQSNKNYEISVRGDLQSAYLAYMNRGDGDSYSFSGKSVNLDSIDIDDLEVVDSHFLRVEFNLPVDEESGFDRNNYRIRDLSTGRDQYPTRIYYEQTEDGIDTEVVYLKFSSLRKEREYEFLVDDVYDLYLESYINRYEEKFEGEEYENVPELDDVFVRDRNTLILEYDRPLSDKATSIDVNIDHGIDVDKICLFEEEPRLLYVYLEKGDYLEEDKDYKLEIDDKVPDYLGLSSNRGESERFPGTDDYMDEVYVEEVINISPGVFMVKFSDYIDMESAVDVNNFALTYKVERKRKYNAPSEVIKVDSKTLVLQFESYMIDEKLTLEIESVQDPSEQYTYENLEYNVGILEE